MSLQAIEREKRFAAPALQRLFPVTRTVSGFEGYQFLKTVSEGVTVTDITVQGSYALATTASVSLSIVGCVYYAGVSGYDADFVKTIQAADAAEPETGFNNVVDMLDWLNRD